MGELGCADPFPTPHCWTVVLIPQDFPSTGSHGPRLYEPYILEKPQQTVPASSLLVSCVSRRKARALAPRTHALPTSGHVSSSFSKRSLSPRVSQAGRSCPSSCSSSPKHFLSYTPPRSLMWRATVFFFPAFTFLLLGTAPWFSSGQPPTPPCPTPEGQEGG